ncbi:NAD-dependent epimerase/dehydratase family protein [Marinobacter sp. X15-166B]|uniref:NAD-dependent epimerase/dehydratase family protein n=1 Tax=Marinobacter sp. X15-166B TaxID=1897620 RepID=UPI00085C1882|nr:NAD-dependent epimerase/dehydratase family protein [Marinobacter sp. X15-166B]OEY66497.1 NAD-dependent epimerase [Marinobacter sp. X15-166B]
MAISPDMERAHILVAGCGKLGGRIASALTDSARVFGLRRNADKVPAGVTGIGADLYQPSTLFGQLPPHLDAVVYCLTPSSYDEQGYRNAYVDGLANLLDVLKGHSLKRLFFISSTSVYAQDDDSWVDESSPTEPDRYSGQHILAGEQLALGSGHPATIIRYSGIYGPGRLRFVEEVKAGRLAPVAPAPFSNRIHEEDAVAAAVHLTHRALTGAALDSCYIVSDCEPVRLDEVVAWVRQQTPCAEALPDARRGGRAGSKRCSNQRLLASGFDFRYPDFRSGYAPLIG